MRPVQQSLVDPSLERPVGPIPMSVVTGNNAQLIASVAELYLTGSVLDVTYGGGKWWDRYRPTDFTFHDIAIDNVDFRDLPHEDGSFDTVCFDPPYVSPGGHNIWTPIRARRAHSYLLVFCKSGGGLSK